MLAERHRARLAMQEGEVSARTETRRGHRVARRLFQDQDQDQDPYHNHDRRNNDEGSGSPRPHAGTEDNLTNRLSEEARQDLAKAKKKWNFDFENERPLPGRWEWRKVEAAEFQNDGVNSENSLGIEEDDNLVVNDDEKNEEEEDEEEDDDDNKVDQREKSETEANEKAVKGGKD